MSLYYTLAKIFNREHAYNLAGAVAHEHVANISSKNLLMQQII